MEIQLSVDQLVGIAKVTRRQLQWWDEKNIIRPYTKENHRRIYGPIESLHVVIAAELRCKGFSPHQIRKVMPSIQRRRAKLLDDLYIVTTADADDCYFSRDEALVTRIIAASPCSMVVLDVAGLKKRIS